MLAKSTAVGEIGWHGMALWEPVAQYYNSPVINSRMWVTGGGTVGTNLNKQINTLVASVSTYWSVDGITWVQTNMHLGGGATGQLQYSSSEWASTLILGMQSYLGIWGHTLEVISGANQTVSRHTSLMYLLPMCHLCVVAVVADVISARNDHDRRRL